MANISNDFAAERPIRIRIGNAFLDGDLIMPTSAIGVVVFVHGSGSSRRSKRNRYVARMLQSAGLGTLLFELLTSEEEAMDSKTTEFRFNVELLAERVVGVVDWLASQASSPIGCFGASTGAAAALVAAARRPDIVRAVVSRGGRPDLAGDNLPRVTAPTLLIVGGDDLPVIGLNQKALQQLGASEKELTIVPGASHLFEEPGTLEQVARLAGEWFAQWLGPQRDLGEQAGQQHAGSMVYANRREAGRRLSTRLMHYSDRADVQVLALPRGGVPVGFEVARALKAPFDVCLVRKLGVPGREELAMGAIASGGLQVVNEDVVRALGIPGEIIDRVAETERRELQRRERAYRDDRPPADVAGRVVVLVDDGLATGTTMRAAVLALRKQSPARIVVAVPVGARETCVTMSEIADEVVCAQMPDQFTAVGLWYADFSQSTDDEVRQLLADC